MDIYLHNTLTNKKEKFEPITSGTVSMYNCGPTVYHYAHIGNLRAYILADTLRRVFEYNGLKVKQVINITDVGHLVTDADEGEDKMRKGAAREGKSIKEIADFYTDAFLEDLKHLNVETLGTIFPKATEHISEQIELIKKLEAKGYTYQTSVGVYFDTQKFPAYGKLGNIDIKGLREGARVEINTEKKSPTDFALWKIFQGEGTREHEWESPWGRGYPGWHIECSAMSMKYLGETFDVHTGGIDHIPVHHNNEIAQSEAGTDKPFVHYWLHGAFVNIEGGKMSKSDNNFLRLQTLIDKRISPLAYRLWLLGGHYSTPLHYSDEAMVGAENSYQKIKSRFPDLGTETGEVISGHSEAFLKLINDDLDTPKALALFWQVFYGDYPDADKRATLLNFDKVLGLDLASIKVLEVPIQIKNLIQEREIARAKNDWARADKIRFEISQLGFRVEDTQDGPKASRL